MNGGIWRGARFFLERWIQKGLLQQLLLMAALVALVAAGGGLVAWIATPNFASAGEAIWWAFLRLTDPGYLGDDEGVVLRVVSTVVTVLGYVLFMGSLIAIMTSWLAQTLRKLESGLTPIRMKDHVLVLGWTNRTPEIVLKLLAARGRLTRFLERQGASKLRVVVLSEEVGAERRLELREYLGEFWDESQVFLRSGSSLQPEHLRRLDLPRASTVIVPGADFELGGAEASDTRVVKTLLTVNGLLRDDDGDSRPQVVGEVFDPLKVPLARNAVDENIEVFASDGVIGRLISQSIRHRGLAQVLFGILSHRQGNSIYLRRFPELAGRSAHDLFEAFPTAVVLGYVRSEDGERSTNLSAVTDEVLREDDLLVLLSENYDRCVHVRELPAEHVRPKTAFVRDVTTATNRILVLGWSHKIGALAIELDKSRSGRFELTIMSRVDVEERERWLQRSDFSEDRVRIRHVDGDYALEKDLVEVHAEGFDNVLFLASDWMASSREADARTILGYVLLRSLLKRVEDPPELLVELLDPDNSHLFHDLEDIYLVTPRVLSYLLAHVALRPELNAVIEALFGAGGSEIDLLSVGELDLAESAVTFLEIQGTALERGVIALGVFTAAGGIELNPDRGKRWTLAEPDFLVVLAAED